MAGKTKQTHVIDNYPAKRDIRLLGDRWVTMSNALIRAAHGLTLAEKRIIAVAVSKLDSRKALPPNDVPRTRIFAGEYAETFDVDISTAYQQLADAAKALYNRSITFYEPASRRRGAPLPPTKVQMRWVGSAKYQQGEGWVEIAWWPDLLQHLVGLKKQFTSYQLTQTSALRSIYSWKLLELLIRFESTGQAEYTIEDFKASMNPPSSLSDFGQIKRRVIEPAVRELMEKDGWLIQWRPVKAGRRVAAVHFDFKRDPQGRLF